MDLFCKTSGSLNKLNINDRFFSITIQIVKRSQKLPSIELFLESMSAYCQPVYYVDKFSVPT